MPPMTAAPAKFPLLDPWEGPYGGIPDFRKVKVSEFSTALKHAIALNRAEIKAIAGNKAAPTFANTIAALEDAGRPLSRGSSFFNIYASTMDDDAMKAVEKEMNPVFAAFGDEVVQNPKLFARIKAVYDKRETSGLTPEQQRLVWVVYRRFVRQGAALDEAGKKRLADVNQELSKLYTDFSQNELGDEESVWLTLEKTDLAGLPDWLVASAADAAKEKKLEGKYVFANTRSAMEPFLTYSTKRDLREKAFRMWTSRGDNNDAHDNKKIIAQICALRAEKAKLLGYATFAHWITDYQMAKTPDAAMDLLMKVWKPAVARVAEEVADMQKLADSEGAAIKIAPWDYRFYAEKVRKAKYDLDEAAIKPYLQLDKIREGMFWASGKVHGLEYKEVHGLPTAHKDIRVFEVTRNGQHVALWYFDPYARAGKSSGAWMNEYRTQERFKKATPPIVSNNCNFVPAGDGKPILISWDDASTMFHEFGHALHGMNSNVTYPTLAGTNVVSDYVEFPSQLNEHWLPTKEVLSRFAVHYETGKPMPDELVAKIKTAKTFNQGFATVEYLASAILDMKIHLAGATPIDAAEFEKKTLAEIGMPAEIVMRHRLPHFGHIFSGEGYAAGYYDYIWADVLVADAAEYFEEAPGGFYNIDLCKKLHDDIISVGNTVEAADAYRKFRGRDATVDALMRDRGFPATAKA
jgi:peptidyl-dipeptidase Dcp